MIEVVFTETHNYGGRIFEKGEQLLAEQAVVDVLIARGVAEKPEGKKRAKKDD